MWSLHPRFWADIVDEPEAAVIPEEYRGEIAERLGKGERLRRWNARKYLRSQAERIAKRKAEVMAGRTVDVGVIVDGG